MNTRILFVVITFLLLASCKKENTDTNTNTPVQAADTTRPVITLNGKLRDTIYLQSTYIDPGASVIDNLDGNISSSLKISGSITNTLTGQYILSYNAKDAAGNQAATVTRTIDVMNNAASLGGNFSVICNYTTQAGNDPSLPTPTITSSTYTVAIVASNTVNTRLDLTTLRVGPVDADALLNLQAGILSISFSAPGYPTGYITNTLSPAHDSFTVEIFSHEQMYPSRTHLCRSVFTKLP